MARGRGEWELKGGGGQRVEMKTSAIVSTIKIKKTKQNKMQTLRSHPRLTESESPFLNTSTGGSRTLKFEKH